MTKLFACFTLFCLIGTAFSVECVTNSLFDIYEFTMETDEIDGADFAYCKSLQGGNSCCSKDTVDGFQADIEEVAEALVEAVIKRDTAIVTLRDTDIPALATKLTALETQATAALAYLATLDAREDEDPVYTAYTEAQAESVATALEALVEDLDANLEDATEEFTAFQQARSSCVIEFLGLQAAAWCLACDPTAADQGVGALGAITIADATCDRLKAACYEYVTASVTQGHILAVDWVSAIIDDMTEALEDLGAATDEATQGTALQALADAAAGAEALDTEVTPAVLPEGCTSEADCDWICEDLFEGGLINEDLLVAGGALGETPIVAPTEADRLRRRLQDEWEPAADEAGVTITWEDDPSGLNPQPETPAGAGIIKSGVVCVIALLSVFFF